MCKLRNLHNLRLRTILAQSQDHATVVRNLEIGIQSQDSDNVQHNLEIAQILRLHGTHTYIHTYIQPQLQTETSPVPTQLCA